MFQKHGFTTKGDGAKLKAGCKLRRNKGFIKKITARIIKTCIRTKHWILIIDMFMKVKFWVKSKPWVVISWVIDALFPLTLYVPTTQNGQIRSNKLFECVQPFCVVGA